MRRVSYIIVAMRIVCLDIGTKRIGVAGSDPFGWTAQGLGVVERKSDEKAFADIAEIVAEREADLLLIGLPLDQEGKEGKAAKAIVEFARKLVSHLRSEGLEPAVKMWDERYSTKTAEERLIGADVSRKRRREVIDKMAAVAILEDYLSSQELSGAGESAEG
jgi:putative Holliday junction resolvase